MLPHRKEGSSRFPWRAVGVGVLLEAITIWWVAESEIAAKVFISSWSLTMTAVLWLLALILWNAILGRLRPRWALSRQELLLIFVMISSTSTIYGYGMMQMLLPTLGAAHYYASPSNRFQEVVHPYLPRWAIVQGEEVLKGLFEGNATVPWGAWLRPILVWGSFLLAFFVASLAFDLLMARSWIRHERLTFPIVALPLEMTRPEVPFFRNGLMWLGFAIPAILESLLALHEWYPAVPAITLKHHRVDEWVVNFPWTALRPILFGVTPFIIGLAYLAPTEISFSCWFFYWLQGFSRVFGAVMGWTDPAGGRAATDFPHLIEQTIGAFFAFALYALWRSRRQFLTAWRSLWRRRQEEDEEAGLYRMALLWLALCLGFLFWFLHALGLPWRTAALLLAVYFLICITLARIRAEAGPAWAFGPVRPPHAILVHGFGSAAFPRQTLVLLGLLGWFFADVRFATLPAKMEALKVADAVQLPKRPFAWVLVLATGVAILLGFVFCLRTSYELGWATAKTYGGPRWYAQWTFVQSVNWIQLPTDPDVAGLPWMVGGGLFCLFLQFMRQRFLWWKFHPIGYIMAHTGASYSFWAHYLIAWFAKVLVLRFGGMNLYRKTIPFVTGVILGDIATQTLWSLYASLRDIPVYQFIS